MTTRHDACPPLEELSALFDGEAGTGAPGLQRHVGACPACAGAVARFATLRHRLEPLRADVGDVHIAEAVLLRLPRRPPRVEPAWWPWAGSALSPLRALGGVAALTAGLALGLSLVAGGAVGQRTGMSVFDAEPAGRLCAGLPSCTREGR